MSAVKQKLKPTRLKDIAEKAEVSRTAVAGVILGTGGDHVRVSDKTRQRILSVAAELGYRPNKAARTLVGGRSGIIGVLVDSRAPALFYECLGHLDGLAMAKGYRLLIGGQHDSLAGVVEHMHDFAAYGAEGGIILSHDYPDFRKEINQLIRLMPNMVCVGNPGYSEAVFVEVDIAAGVRQLMEYFFTKGRKRIGMVLSGFSPRPCALRYQGYLEGLQIHGIDLDPNLVVIDEKAAEMNGFDVDATLDQLVVTQKVDAIIAQNDLVAAALISTLHQRGLRVPEDIAVAGADDSPMSRFYIPPLTTIRQVPEKVAAAVFDLLLQLIEKTTPEVGQVSIQPEVIFREST